MKKYIAEFIGTFFLVLSIVLIYHNTTPIGFAPVAVGFLLVGLVYAGSHISGAHYNPIVTLGFFIHKKMTMNDALAYVLAQFIAAIFAAFTAMTLLEAVGTAKDPEPKQIDAVLSIVAEFLGTFIWAYVALSTSLKKNNSENSFYGLAIGATLVGISCGLAPISGGAFNPAIAVGLCTIKAFDWANLWVYLLGTLLGGGVAAVLYGFLNDERD